MDSRKEGKGSDKANKITSTDDLNRANSAGNVMMPEEELFPSDKNFASYEEARTDKSNEENP
ncbi:MAG: hypothetical protein LBV43_07505, partial [Prevotella sp.]|nr:hypothetical protein [Prevotella sp.]